LIGGTATFLYVGGNPIGLADRRGLYTEVLRWATDGSGAGAWGHISGNINGTNWSWGPNGWDTNSSADAYASKQVDVNHRDGEGIILDLSPDEERKLLSCLASYTSGYNGITNNCGTPWLKCLAMLGVAAIGDQAHVLPMDVIKIISDSPRAVGTTQYTGIGNKGFDTPPIFVLFDSLRRKLGF
jgi:hypothetical protein